MGKKIIEIIWSGPAMADLQTIHAFLSEKSHAAADKEIDRIIAKVEVLETGFTKVGQAEVLLKDADFEYHYLIQGHYKIIYRVFSGKVEIAAVFDTRQNPDKLPKKV